MTKHKAQEAIKHLEKIQQLMSKTHSPYTGLSKQEAIEKIRKVRERLWEERFTSRS